MSRGWLVRRFPVLGIRDFRLLLGDRLIAPASVGFSIVGVSFAVLKATNSATDLSYVLAAQIAPSLVFALIGGVAADRFPPQRVIVAANLLMALGEGTFGVLVLTTRPPLWAMLGLEAITGTGVALFYPASQALLPRLVPRDLLQEASAISRLAMNTGQEHLGGPAAWGAITAADAFGLIAGGLASLRFTPRRPMLFVVLTGGAVAISPLSLAMVLPLAAVCVASFGLGVFVEMMMVVWTVTMARNIPPDKLARVSSYDVLGSVMAMPAGALIAGPLGTAIGISHAQYAAAAVIIVASALALIPRDIRTIRSSDAPAPVAPAIEETPARLEATPLRTP